MKRILASLAIIIIPMFAHAAELSVGTIQLTGGSNLGFNSTTTSSEWNGISGDDVKESDFSLSAKGLYYVTSNVGVGATLSYLSDTVKIADNEQGFSTLVIGPAVAYDLPVAEKLSVFGEAMVGYATRTDTATGSADYTTSGFGFGLGVGVKYFLVRSVSIDASLAYNYAKTTGDDIAGYKPEYTQSGFGLGLGLSVYLGGSGSSASSAPAPAAAPAPAG